MERRKFLKLLAGASAMAVCPISGSAEPSPAPRRGKPLTPGPRAGVFLAGVRRGAAEQAIKLAVRGSAEAATDFSWLSRGDAVFIKPVNNSGNPYPATTSPIAIAAMVELLREKGAGRVIVGDMSGVQYVRFSATARSGSTRGLMESSGIARAAQASGAEIHCFEEAGWEAFYEDVPAVGTNWKHALMMPNILKEVQHIVLMPRCSRHILSGSTLGLKAAVGYWRHDTRLEYHRDAATLQEKTAEGNTVATLRTKQRLVVTAADRVLTTFGPDKGYVFEPEPGLVIASESVVAHDMVALAWLLENRRAMPEPQKKDLLDMSTVAPRFANHLVTFWLGGWAPARDSETLVKNDLRTIWDDRVLTRACEVFGGAPGVALQSVDGSLPEDLKTRLAEMTALPA